MSAKGNEVSEQAVQADRGEGDGGRAEGAEQPGVETAGGGLDVDQFFQRRYPCERLIRIQLREPPHEARARSQPVPAVRMRTVIDRESCVNG